MQIGCIPNSDSTEKLYLPILSDKWTVTIDPLITFDGDGDGDGTCKLSPTECTACSIPVLFVWSRPWCSPLWRRGTRWSWRTSSVRTGSVSWRGRSTRTALGWSYRPNSPAHLKRASNVCSWKSFLQSFFFVDNRLFHSRKSAWLRFN